MGDAIHDHEAGADTDHGRCSTRATTELSMLARTLQQKMARDLEEKNIAQCGGVLPEFAKGLFTGIIFLSTFGGSITFQTIIQDLGENEDSNPGHRFSRKRARTFLAISWLLFVVDLGVSALLIAMLYLYRGHKQSSWADTIYVRVLSFIFLPGVLVGALLFSSLAVTAYSEPTGWTAVGFCGAFGLTVLIWWFVEIIIYNSARHHTSVFGKKVRTQDQETIATTDVEKHSSDSSGEHSELTVVREQ